jgi:hypothetical protein
LNVKLWGEKATTKIHAIEIIDTTKGEDYF